MMKSNPDIHVALEDLASLDGDSIDASEHKELYKRFSKMIQTKGYEASADVEFRTKVSTLVSSVLFVPVVLYLAGPLVALVAVLLGLLSSMLLSWHERRTTRAEMKQNVDAYLKEALNARAKVITQVTKQ